MRSTLTRLVLLSVLLLVAVPVSADMLIEIDDLREGDLEVVGFELPKPAEVDIEALGARLRFNDRLVVYAWILDHTTRETVWVMNESRSGRHHGSKVLRQVEKTLMLDKGKYELYMYAGGSWNFSIRINGGKDFLGFLGDLFDGEEDFDDYYDDLDRYVDKCYVRISSTEVTASEVGKFDVTGEIPGALLTLNQLGDDEYVRQGLTFDKAMNLRIYSLIELPRGYKTPVDYGWIIDADTREKVWEIDRWNTERAGGGRKNRKFDDEVRLEKGNYILYFATDDSHSWEKFNTSPPEDPLNWGITLLPGTDFDASAFHLTEAPGRSQALIDFSMARDEDYMEQAFELKKSTTLLVYALGEFSDRDDEFVDYGWIQEAKSGKIIWEMTERNTEHAGGGSKNRMFEGYMTLDAGRYIAIYLTDDSHSYRNWNVSQPFEPRAWGMTIYPGPDFKTDQFVLLDEKELESDTDILAKLVRMRDSRERRDRFTLDKSTRVHVYAIGEGSRGSMYDYGWIVDDETGRAIWEMTWRNTEHAGGARKNRMFNDDIILEPGTYEVYYSTDGSHSFSGWNARRPRDPMNWGITVSVAD